MKHSLDMSDIMSFVSDSYTSLMDRAIASLDDTPRAVSKPPATKPVIKPTKTYIPTTIVASTTPDAKSPKSIKGRSIWKAFYRKGNSSSGFVFQSVPCTQEGAYALALRRACEMLGCGAQDIILVEAGGFASHYDESDKSIFSPKPRKVETISPTEEEETAHE